MTGFMQDIGGGLVLRTVRDAHDIAQYAALHAQHVNGREGRACEQLILRHPAMVYDDFMVVEDTSIQEIVSTICLIPWDCRFDGVALRVAMLEMVVTHPDYRRRGLVRRLIERFHAVAEEHNFDLCLIEGIPYYYRQFGYAYATDHRSYDALAAGSIPAGSDDPDARFSFRPATHADIPVLMTLYRHAMTDVAFHVERDEAYWRYLLDDVVFPVNLIMDRDSEQAAGYAVIASPAGASVASVIESAVSHHDASMALLRRLKSQKSAVLHLAWPQSNPLIQTARSLGSAPHPTYQWLFRIIDTPAFLHKLGPALERRLAASDCAGMTGELSINLFHEAFKLVFDGGRLEGVHPIGFVDASMGADGGDLCIPPDAFVRLALGYRGLDALRDAWPDIVVRPGSRRILDILFPEMTAYLCTPYLYLGVI